MNYNFNSLAALKAGAKSGDSSKNFPSVSRPARSIVSHKQTCSMLVDADMGDVKHGKVNLSPKKAF